MHEMNSPFVDLVYARAMHRIVFVGCKNDTVKKEYANYVNSLRGQYLDSTPGLDIFPQACTHLIVFDFRHGKEYVLIGLATGKFILKPSFILASRDKGKWDLESLHLFKKTDPAVNSLAQNVGLYSHIALGRYWHQYDDKGGFFADWKAGVVCSTSKKKDFWGRVLRGGGASYIKGITKQNCRLPSIHQPLTHVFVDDDSPPLNSDVFIMLKNNVAVLVFSFIEDYIFGLRSESIVDHLTFAKEFWAHRCPTRTSIFNLDSSFDDDNQGKTSTRSSPPDDIVLDDDDERMENVCQFLNVSSTTTITPKVEYDKENVSASSPPYFGLSTKKNSSSLSKKISWPTSSTSSSSHKEPKKIVAEVKVSHNRQKAVKRLKFDSSQEIRQQRFAVNVPPPSLVVVEQKRKRGRPFKTSVPPVLTKQILKNTKLSTKPKSKKSRIDEEFKVADIVDAVVGEEISPNCKTRSKTTQSSQKSTPKKFNDISKITKVVDEVIRTNSRSSNNVKKFNFNLGIKKLNALNSKLNAELSAEEILASSNELNVASESNEDVVASSSTILRSPKKLERNEFVKFIANCVQNLNLEVDQCFLGNRQKVSEQRPRRNPEILNHFCSSQIEFTHEEGPAHYIDVLNVCNPFTTDERVPPAKLLSLLIETMLCKNYSDNLVRSRTAIYLGDVIRLKSPLYNENRSYWRTFLLPASKNRKILIEKLKELTNIVLAFTGSDDERKNELAGVRLYFTSVCDILEQDFAGFLDQFSETGWSSVNLSSVERRPLIAELLWPDGVCHTVRKPSMDFLKDLAKLMSDEDYFVRNSVAVVFGACFECVRMMDPSLEGLISCKKVKLSTGLKNFCREFNSILNDDTSEHIRLPWLRLTLQRKL